MAYIYLLLAAIFWGGNYVVSRVMVFHLPPGLLAEARWGIAALLLLIMYGKQVAHNKQLLKKSWLRTAFLALFGPVLFPTTLYIGLQYTTALNAAILLSSSPTLVLLINAVIFRDRINLHNIVGVCLSWFGVIYLLTHGHIDRLFDLSIGVGEMWAFLSALSWAIYCSSLRIRDKNIPGTTFLTVSAVFGAIMLAPYAIYEVDLPSLYRTHFFSILRSTFKRNRGLVVNS
ncbi:DMT family transporter [Candidiatus Paracoxiella cheracis]|uniref:DMT family transporter n=1 Tax=Candidiatus Paracoxiella cheracis TaxID=3405120 RepID=UPI003BF5977E